MTTTTTTTVSSKKKNKNKKNKRPKHASLLSSAAASGGDQEENEKNSKTNKKRRRMDDQRTRERIAKEEKEERKLTSMIFGEGEHNDDDDESIPEAEKEPAFQKDAPEDEGEEEPQPLFVIDKTRNDDPTPEAEPDKKDEKKKKKKTKKHEKKKEDSPNVVWHDDDEEAAESDHDTTTTTNNKNNNKVSLLSNYRNRRLRTSLAEKEISMSDYAHRQRSQFVYSTTARVDWAQAPAVAVAPSTTTLAVASDDDEEITADALFNSAAPLLATTKSSSSSITTTTTSSHYSSTVVTPGDDASLSRRRPRYPLPPSELSIVRCPDVNRGLEGKSDAVARCVHFHPTQPNLLLTAGLDRKLRFFRIDDQDNDQSSLQHTVWFRDLPLHQARFVTTGVGDNNHHHNNKVFCCGPRSYFYTYDLEADKTERLRLPAHVKERSFETMVVGGNQHLAFLGKHDGFIYLWDVKNHNLGGTLKINGSVRCATFANDGKELLCSGSDGDVYRYDISTRRCISRFSNEDGTVTSALAVGHDFLSVGAESGVVNLYKNDHNDTIENNNHTRKPIRSILNLHTPVSTLKVHPSSELMCLASRYEKGALRLWHARSGGIYPNWPTSKTPLSYVFDVDFNACGKYLAMGNDKGNCLLYKLKHYA